MNNKKLYERIKELCLEKGITINKLEIATGLANNTIRKWVSSTPSVGKVQVVADYFNVSIDYLVGNTDIRTATEEILDDPDIISIQRARQQLDTPDKDRMMEVLKLTFGEVFND